MEVLKILVLSISYQALLQERERERETLEPTKIVGFSELRPIPIWHGYVAVLAHFR